MQLPHKDNRVSKGSKSSHDRVSAHQPDELTCNEGQVEDLLSQGESTESEGDDDGGPNERISPKSSLRKTASLSASSRPRK